MKLRWTSLAIKDLGHAFDYIAQENLSAARDAITRVENTATMLAQYSHLGRGGRVEGTRELVVSGTPFVVAYRVKSRRIEILAVIHAARRWPETI